jgi:predicted nucleotidyltransferase
VTPSTQAGAAPAAHAEAWIERLRRDRERAARNQTSELAAVTALVERRCRELGAQGFVLTGSTARGRRTPVSDLDYHVIGPRPDISDLAADVDLYGDDPNEFATKLREGDDFVHWSVRCGCVLFDAGPIERAAELIAESNLWPDDERKLRQARSTIEFAAQMLASGDYEAALEQTRGALSLTARWYLLRSRVFPLARDELGSQLSALGCDQLAEGLRRSIHERPTCAALGASLAAARALVERHE